MVHGSISLANCHHRPWVLGNDSSSLNDGPHVLKLTQLSTYFTPGQLFLTKTVPGCTSLIKDL